MRKLTACCGDSPASMAGLTSGPEVPKQTDANRISPVPRLTAERRSPVNGASGGVDAVAVMGSCPSVNWGFVVITLSEPPRSAIEFFPVATQDFCVKLDEIDHLLLDELQTDAGRTLRALGEVVGLSPSAVQRRMERYRDSGLVSRTTAVLDPKASRDLVMAIVLVAVERESPRLLEAYQRRLLAAPEVQQLYGCYGGWDYVAVLVTSGMAHHNEVSQRLFAEAPNIRQYSTMLVLGRVGSWNLGRSSWSARSRTRLSVIACMIRLCARIASPGLSADRSDRSTSGPKWTRNVGRFTTARKNETTLGTRSRQLVTTSVPQHTASCAPHWLIVSTGTSAASAIRAAPDLPFSGHRPGVRLIRPSG